MKLIITTPVWAGEYDPSEFMDGHTTEHIVGGWVHVTEEMLLNPASTVTLTESSAPGM